MPAFKHPGGFAGRRASGKEPNQAGTGLAATRHTGVSNRLTGRAARRCFTLFLKYLQGLSDWSHKCLSKSELVLDNTSSNLPSVVCGRQ